MRARPIIFLLFFLPSIVQAQDPAPLRVAVAANFINIIETVAPAYTANFTTPVQPAYGSTGKLYAQIHNGAPYDLFLAADHSRPQLLYEEGICEKPFLYAFGSVVLWSWDTEGIKGDNWQEVLKLHSGKMDKRTPTGWIGSMGYSCQKRTHNRKSAVAGSWPRADPFSLQI